MCWDTSSFGQDPDRNKHIKRQDLDAENTCNLRRLSRHALFPMTATVKPLTAFICVKNKKRFVGEAQNVVPQRHIGNTEAMGSICVATPGNLIRMMEQTGAKQNVDFIHCLDRKNAHGHHVSPPVCQHSGMTVLWLGGPSPLRKQNGSEREGAATKQGIRGFVLALPPSTLKT